MKRFSKITTTQLARICGVSQGTIDRALHNRSGINPETRARILEIAKEYDYRPTIQSGGNTNSMLIGVVLFDLNNSHNLEIGAEPVSPIFDLFGSENSVAGIAETGNNVAMVVKLFIQ